jgi:FlaA1/EpsC-like NDP-sugar epimerase
MGEPVKIVDLARDMIRLSGLEVGEDIEIEFTGIRPGEKLYEEMFFSHEVAEPTIHPKVLRSKNGKHDAPDDAAIQLLIDAARNGEDQERIRTLLKQLVPDFTNGAQPTDTAVAGKLGPAGKRNSGGGAHEVPARRAMGGAAGRAGVAAGS